MNYIVVITSKEHVPESVFPFPDRESAVIAAVDLHIDRYHGSDSKRDHYLKRLFSSNHLCSASATVSVLPLTKYQ